MARKSKNYDNEILNLRAFYLLVLKRLWLAIVGAIVFAMVFGGVYTLKTVIDRKDARYEVNSTLYIYFAYNENSGTEVDYYNAFTWNTLIKSDEVVLPVMDTLSELGYDLSREEVEASMNADIPSDVRVMVLTAYGKDKETAKAMSDAANKSLVGYGISNPAFEQIKVLSQDEPSISIGADRLSVAVIFGAVCGLILTILTELLIASMDDEVHIPEDAEKRYHIPVLGMITAKGKEEPSFLRNELINSMGSIAQKMGKIAVMSVDDIKGAEHAEAGTEQLKNVLGNAFDFEITRLVPLELPGNDDKSLEKLEEMQGAIICMDMGKKNGAMTEHLISMLHKMECPIVGIIITDTDTKFIERYLGL